LVEGNVGIGIAAPTSILHAQQAADSAVTATPVALDINSAGATGELTASSGTQTFARIAPVINQSSTAGYTALLVNSTETATGSGAKNLIDLQVAGSSRLLLSSAGALSLTPTGQTVASASGAEFTTGTFTPPTITLTGTTQVTSQMDSFIFNQPTITDASAVTVDDAATLTVAGAPIKAGSVTLTDTYALKVNAGAVSTATRSYGLYVDAQTGATNNYAAAFASGNVGVGTATPTSIFHVVTAANAVDGAALFAGAADNVGVAISNTGTGGAIRRTKNTSVTKKVRRTAIVFGRPLRLRNSTTGLRAATIIYATNITIRISLKWYRISAEPTIKSAAIA
jgi:hypothetical protein